MLKKLLHGAAALLFSAGIAFGAFNLGFDGKFMPQGSGTAPALTSCGGASPAIVGTDIAGTVTMGSSATGCVITFNVPYVAAPHCIVQWIANRPWPRSPMRPPTPRSR
jgi:hypothetical protein